jgi:hypothetical protein
MLSVFGPIEMFKLRSTFCRRGFTLPKNFLGNHLENHQQTSPHALFLKTR